MLFPKTFSLGVYFLPGNVMFVFFLVIRFKEQRSEFCYSHCYKSGKKYSILGSGGWRKSLLEYSHWMFLQSASLTSVCYCFDIVFLFFSFSNISKKAHYVLSTVWIICCKESTLVLLSYPPLHSSWMRKKEWEWQREECLAKNIEHFYR